MITSIIYAIGGFIEMLVALRFVLRLLGANAANSFVNWVYSWSTPIVTPFSGIFGKDATVVHGVGTAMVSVFDWTAVIAFIVIGLVLGFVGTFIGGRK